MREQHSRILMRHYEQLEERLSAGLVSQSRTFRSTATTTVRRSDIHADLTSRPLIRGVFDAPYTVYDFEADDAVRDALSYTLNTSTALTSQPKKTTMNEILDSLEAMIRRIVKEEIAVAPVVVDDRDFDRGFERYVDNNSGKWTALVKQGVGVPAPMPMPASLGVLDSAAFAAQLKNFAQLRPVEFALLVKDATLDQGWFDDAITAQVVAAGDVSSQTDFETKFKRIADGTSIVFRVVRDAVEGAEWFTEYVQDTVIGSDALDDQITKVVSNMSIVA